MKKLLVINYLANHSITLHLIAKYECSILPFISKLFNDIIQMLSQGHAGFSDIGEDKIQIEISEKGIHDRFTSKSYENIEEDIVEKSSKNQKCSQSQPTLDREHRMGSSKSENNSYGLLTDIKQMKVYGPAVFLLFSFLKKMIKLFAILSVISLILIIYNISSGDTFASKINQSAILFARASLGAFNNSQNSQKKTKVLYEVIIGVNIVILFSFWIYWKGYMEQTADKMQQQLQLSSREALYLEGQGIKDVDDLLIKDELISKFGSVQEAIKIVNRGQQIQKAYNIYKIQQNIKQLNNQIKDRRNPPSSIQKNIDNLAKKLQKSKNQLEQQKQKQKKYQNLKYIIKFDSFAHRSNALNRLKKIACFSQNANIQVINEKQIYAVPCQAQPWGIYWQNMHVGIKQLIIPNIVLFLTTNVVALSTIALIGLISTFASPVYYDPFSYANDYSEQEILKDNNTNQVASWCIAQSHYHNSSIEGICREYITRLNERAGIYLAIAIVLSLSRLAMKKTILKVAQYIRFKDHNQKSNTITMHLFINYTIVSVVIALSVQTNLFGTAMSTVLSYIFRFEPVHSRLLTLKQYYDYTPEWYADYGFQLIINYIVIAIIPYISSPLVHFLRMRLRRNSQESQQQQQFQLEDHYASCFMAIIVGLVFAGAMPVLFPLIFAALVIRFFSLKYLLLNANNPPKITDRLMARRIPTIIIVGIIVYTMNVIWALGVEAIFDSKYHSFSSLGIDENSNAHTIPEAFLVFLRRVANSWPILLTFLLGIVMILFHQKTSKIWIKIMRIIRNTSTEMNQNACGQIHIQMHNMDANDQQNLQRSYDPLNNQKYKQIFSYLRVR